MALIIFLLRICRMKEKLTKIFDSDAGIRTTRKRCEASKEEGPVSDWSARQYLLFEEERTRPAIDMLNRVPPGSRDWIVDLGCGPGTSTEVLAARFPTSQIIGVDTSADMLAAAQLRLPLATFEQASVSKWHTRSPPDLMFANAVMQWVPQHLSVMKDLLEQMAPGGCLAVQMPDNRDEPSHVLMREIARRPSFRDKLSGAAAARESIGGFGDYVEGLSPSCDTVDVWRTTYVHCLAGPSAIRRMG
jgi:trans-aconitate 2-methyltransferase